MADLDGADRNRGDRPCRPCDAAAKFDSPGTALAGCVHRSGAGRDWGPLVIADVARIVRRLRTMRSGSGLSGAIGESAGLHGAAAIGPRCSGADRAGGGDGRGTAHRSRGHAHGRGRGRPGDPRRPSRPARRVGGDARAPRSRSGRAVDPGRPPRRRPDRLPRRPPRRPGRRDGASRSLPEPGRCRPRVRAEADAEAGSPRAPTPCAFADIVPAFRDQVAKYGSDRMAFPYGGTALVLVYDREAFEREANRTAAEGEGLTLEPPKTWESSTPWPGSSRGATGTATARPITASPCRWGPTPRAWATRSSSPARRAWASTATSTPSSSTPTRWPPGSTRRRSSRRSRALVALEGVGPPGMARFDAEAARQAFREGKVAMLIDRAERPSRWTTTARPADRRGPVAGLGAGLRPRPQGMGGRAGP